MKSGNGIIKNILIVITLIFSIIGFFSTISFLVSDSKYSSNEGIALNSVVEESTSIEEKKVTENNDIEFKFSDPVQIQGSDYSVMKVLVEGGTSNSLYKRAGYNQYHIVNMLFYNSNVDDYQLLFEEKVLLLDKTPRYNQEDSSESLMFILAVSKDTDGDKYLTENDNHILFTCDKNGRSLLQITKGNFSVEEFKFVDKNNLLITVLESEKDKPRENWERCYLQYNLIKNSMVDNNKFESSFIKAKDILNK